MSPSSIPEVSDTSAPPLTRATVSVALPASWKPVGPASPPSDEPASAGPVSPASPDGPASPASGRAWRLRTWPATCRSDRRRCSRRRWCRHLEVSAVRAREELAGAQREGCRNRTAEPLKRSDGDGAPHWPAPEPGVEGFRGWARPNAPDDPGHKRGGAHSDDRALSDVAQGCCPSGACMPS